jgi:hypothetical protein
MVSASREDAAEDGGLSRFTQVMETTRFEDRRGT